MSASFAMSCVFPCMSPKVTARYYVQVLGFQAEFHLDSAEPHVRLFRDGAGILLTYAQWKEVLPNRQLYGYGLDASLDVEDPDALYARFVSDGVQIVRPLQTTDAQRREFVVEDIDGRWIAFGKAVQNTQTNGKSESE